MSQHQRHLTGGYLTGSADTSRCSLERVCHSILLARANIERVGVYLVNETFTAYKTPILSAARSEAGF